jgi:hypothetical protein
LCVSVLLCGLQNIERKKLWLMDYCYWSPCFCWHSWCC